ncbi:hypothetical protein HPP92_027802 [Vanilla planifolia]|uniref:Uncharacterized protein n=1 Tax=Vanilla planifolia TaxID=51239 RepID=A0A835PDL3_VANPL|nr:hypothetical protein HPP92_027802 [Vanilla planifolia]
MAWTAQGVRLEATHPRAPTTRDASRNGELSCRKTSPSGNSSMTNSKWLHLQPLRLSRHGARCSSPCSEPSR